MFLFGCIADTLMKDSVDASAPPKFQRTPIPNKTVSDTIRPGAFSFTNVPATIPLLEK
jgi:hypothetical protein